MIPPDQFVETLRASGIRRYTGVPCSFFQAAINQVLRSGDLTYTMVPNEGAALALASGAAMAGEPTALLIQNSGFGNLVNPLTSLNMIYKIPVLVFMSGRAYGVPDEPQHEIIGKTMSGLLDTLGVRHADMPDEIGRFRDALNEAMTFMAKEKAPFFFLVKKGTVSEDGEPPVRERTFPMKRAEAIGLLMSGLSGQELVVATTGKPSRELFALKDRPGNFYMQGSMGHAPSIALGTALARPDKKVVVLDGDGALLMHMGILSSVGHYRPANYYHAVLDNRAYETTGDQDTTASTTDFAAAAKACGYRTVATAENAAELKATWASMLRGEGPAFLRVCINREPTDGIARISSRYTSAQIADLFRAGVRS